MTRIDRRTVLLGGLALAGSSGQLLATPERVDLARLRKDPRLGKPVTLRSRRATLSEALAAIQQATGVQMRVAADLSDEPAVVFVKEQPASEVMRQLALLFNYQWRRSGAPDSYRYEIDQDAASRSAEQALRDEDLRRVITAIREQIRLSLDLLQHPREQRLQELQAAQETLRHPPGSASLPLVEGLPQDPQAAGERARAAIRRLTAALDPHQIAFLQFADSFGEEQWRLLLDEGKIVFSTRDEPETYRLPPPVARVISASVPPWREPGMERPAAARPEDQARFDEEDRRMADQQRDAWSHAEAFQLFCRLTLKDTRAIPRAQFTMSPAAVVPDKEWPVVARGLFLYTSPEQTDEPVTMEVSPEEAEKDPVLSRRRAWVLDRKPDDSGRWWDGWLTLVLPSLAESYELNLIADGYRIQRARPPSIRAEEELTLYDALNRHLLRAAAWKRDGDFLRIRRRRWPTIRRTEIADHTAAEWAAFLRAGPRVSIEELIALVLAFRDAQLDETFQPVMEEQGIELPECLEEIDADSHPGARELLRTCGALSPPLQRRLIERNPVPFAAMPPAARAHLAHVLQEWFPFVSPPRAQLEAGELRLWLWDAERTVSQTDDGYSIDYRITGDLEAPGSDGRTLFPHGFARRITMPDLLHPPPAGGQSLQVAQFQYTYGDRKAVNATVILPWIRLLPKPATPMRETAKP